MTDNLRDRIAAAIRAVDDMRVCKLSDADIKFMSDAVIAGLELSYQYENGRVMYDTKPSGCKANGNWRYRIVSPHKEYVEVDS